MNYILSILLLLTTPVFACASWGVMSVKSAVESVGACTTSNDVAIYDYSSDTGTGGYASNSWIGDQFTTTATQTITEYVIQCYNYAELGKTVDIAIYGDSGGDRGVIVSGTSATYDNDDCNNSTTTASEVIITLSTPKTGLTAGTYWLVVSPGSGEYVGMDGATRTGARRYDNDGYLSNYSHATKVMGCEE